MAACQRCGADLGLFKSLTGGALCATCADGRKRALLAFEHAVCGALSDRLLTPDEEAQLRLYQFDLGLSDADVAQLAPALWRGKLLHAILADQLAQPNSCPVVLRKKEAPRWVEGATLLEERTRQVYVGGSRGVSVRIVKGVTWRVGASRGERLPVTEIQTIGQGSFIVTNQRTVFVGPRQVIVPHGKLLSVTPFEDGIELHYEGQKRRQLFQVNDGELTAAAVIMGSQV